MISLISSPEDQRIRYVRVLQLPLPQLCSVIPTLSHSIREIARNLPDMLLSHLLHLSPSIRKPVKIQYKSVGCRLASGFELGDVESRE